MSFLGDLESRFTDRENFYLAFKKLKHYLIQGNEWYNPVELAAYEGNLATNIETLIKLIKDGNYFPSKMELLPFPKKNKKGEKRIRQYFRVAIEDQIVWIAITNVIGRFCEKNMPFWSYGNRLFRPVWLEEENGKKEFKKGSFTSSNSNLYRKWNQSWPFYRRHISMTIKIMGYNSGFDPSLLNEGIEQDIYSQEAGSEANKYLYFDKSFWKSQENHKLYWATLDFEDFFPSIKTEIVLNNIRSLLIKDDGTSRDDIALILGTIERLLKIDYEHVGWSETDLNMVKLFDNEPITNLPTGLLVSGFLANIAMINVDKKLTDYIRRHRTCAIFKYVDDQTVIGTSQEDLLDFLNFYHNILKEENIGVNFQTDKIDPKEGISYSSNEGFKAEDNSQSLNLDIEFPEPLMTMTLEKMSNLNDEDYDLMDTESVKKTTADLTHFMLADFPDSEMKRETRIAFAATKLCQLGKRITPDFKKLDKSLHENILFSKVDFAVMSNSIDTEIKQPSAFQLEKIAHQRQLEERKHLEVIMAKNLTIEIKEINKQHRYIFNLLLKAAFENPDKLKLWKRCAEYCFSTGFDGISLMKDKIEETDLHELGKGYIKAFTLLSINQLLLDAINQINAEDHSFWELRTSLRFIENVLKCDMKSFSIPALPFILETVESNLVLKEFIGLTKSLIEKAHLFELNPKASNFSPENFSSFKFKFNQYFWFILSQIKGANKLNLWEQNIWNLDLSDRLSWSILLFFPDKIPKSIFNQFAGFKSNADDFIYERVHFLHDGTGILYDIFNRNNSIKRHQLKNYPILKRALTKQIDYLNIEEWITIVISGQKKLGWMDPRLSEWTQLEIIKQIALLIEMKSAEIDIFNLDEYGYYLTMVHQTNYCIHRSWATDEKLTWKKWKDITKENTIKLKNKNDLISDHRYLPLEQFWETANYTSLFGNAEFACIISLSVLLIRLLSKSFEWPSSSNKIAFIDQLYAQSLNTMEQYPVSSSTRVLLGNVFSKRDLDFFARSHQFELEDGSKISNLKEFIKSISDIQNELEQFQSESFDQMPRQLTLVDIEKFNSATKS